MERPGDPTVGDRRTPRQRAGDVAEATVADVLRRGGWVVLARKLRVGSDELDIVALDPGPPATMVVVEVRSRRSRHFGSQEERLDEAKVRRLYRAVNALRAGTPLPGGRVVPPGFAWRLDLVALDSDRGRLRHLKGIIPR